MTGYPSYEQLSLMHLKVFRHRCRRLKRRAPNGSVITLGLGIFFAMIASMERLVARVLLRSKLWTHMRADTPYKEWPLMCSALL